MTSTHPPSRRILPKLPRTPLAAAVALVLLACGGDAPPPGEAPGEEPSHDEAGTAAGTEAGVPAPELSEEDFADELSVDLDAMERRESGLYVRTLEEGEGPPAEPGDSMYVHYTVWLPDGTKLDASHDHQPPEPLPMALGETRLIEGWTEGVTGMREGETRRLAVPWPLAYGARGRPPRVPPHAPLLFEVELVRLASGEGS